MKTKVQGIESTYGENDYQIYWETQVKGVYYCLFLLKQTSFSGWSIIANYKEEVRTLNAAIRGGDGTLETDPLYSPSPLSLEKWMEKLATFIHSNQKAS